VARDQESASRDAALISDPSCASTIRLFFNNLE